MRTRTQHLRQILAIFLLLSLALPGCVSPPAPTATLAVQVTAAAPDGGAYPPPPTAALLGPTPTRPAYPPPGQFPDQTYTPGPTRTPTTTPWPVLALPPVPLGALPALVKEARLLYVDHAQRAYFTILPDGSGQAQWNVAVEHPDGFREETLRFAPDGSGAIFTLWDSVTPHVASIWKLLPDGSAATLLLATQNWCFPRDAIWSPDARQIAYQLVCWTTDASGQVRGDLTLSQLWVMQADGTNPRMVSDAPAVGDIEGIGGTACVFLWMRNGYIYFTTRFGELLAVSVHDGALYTLVRGIDRYTEGEVFAPDGVHVIPSDRDAPAYAAAGMIPIRVDGEFLGWSADGALYLYRQEGQLFVQDLAAGQSRLILSGVPVFAYSTMVGGLSPDGRYVAYQTEEGLFALDLTDGRARLVAADAHNPVTGSPAIRFVAWFAMP